MISFNWVKSIEISSRFHFMLQLVEGKKLGARMDFCSSVT